MAAEKEENSMSAENEIAAKREMECRRRVAEILNPKKETADKLPLQISYPRKNDQAPFGDRKLGKQVLEKGERSTSNITNRIFNATQKPWQRSNLQITEKRINGLMPHSRSFMFQPKPVSDQAGLCAQKYFCEVCRVECSGLSSYVQAASFREAASNYSF